MASGTTHIPPSNLITGFQILLERNSEAATNYLHIKNKPKQKLGSQIQLCSLIWGPVFNKASGSMLWVADTKGPLF